MYKKAFTLTEVLATLVILGILIAIAIPSVSKLQEKFKDSYYEELDDTVLESSKSYFKDNTLKRPLNILESSFINYNTLIESKYLDNINVYNSDSLCDGWVVIIKDKEDYIYRNCMKCGTYKNYTGYKAFDESNNYCSDAWKNNNNITTGYDNLDKIYLYRDKTFINSVESNNKIKEKLKVNKTFVKKDSNGNILKEVLLDEGYYPINISNVTLNEEKVYNLSYNIEDVNASRILQVFEHEEPSVSIDKMKVNLYHVGNYLGSNTNLNLSFSHYEESINGSSWKRVGCTNKDNCIIDYSNYPDSSIKVKYRMIDNEGNISKETNEHTIILVGNNPTLEITSKLNDCNGLDYNGDWTNKNICIFLKASDVTSDMTLVYKAPNDLNWKELTSIYKESNNTKEKTITISISKGQVLEGSYSFAIKKDSSYISVKTQVIKIDKKAPDINLVITDINYNDYDSNWTNKNLYFNAFVKDSESGLESVNNNQNLEFNIQLSTNMDSHYYNHNGTNYKGNEYTRYFVGLYNSFNNQIQVTVKDKVGNTAILSKTIKIDKTKPTTPTIKLSSDTFTKEDITFTITSGSDLDSGIQKTEYRIDGGSWVIYTNETTLLTNTGEAIIEARSVDNVGNYSNIVSKTGKCDKTPPKVDIITTYSDYTNYDSSWTNKNVYFNIFVKDSESGIKLISPNNISFTVREEGVNINDKFSSYKNSGYTRYLGVISNDFYKTITVLVEDNAGNKTQVSKVIKVDKTPPEFTLINTNTRRFVDSENAYTIFAQCIKVSKDTSLDKNENFTPNDCPTNTYYRGYSMSYGYVYGTNLSSVSFSGYLTGNPTYLGFTTNQDVYIQIRIKDRAENVGEKCFAIKRSKSSTTKHVASTATEITCP